MKTRLRFHIELREIAIVSLQKRRVVVVEIHSSTTVEARLRKKKEEGADSLSTATRFSERDRGNLFSVQNCWHHPMVPWLQPTERGKRYVR